MASPGQRTPPSERTQVASARRRFARVTDAPILFPLLGVLLLGLVWLGTIGLVRVERASASRETLVLTQELLDTYEAQVVRALREIERTLALLEYQFEQSGSAIPLADLEARGLLPPPLVFPVSVFDGTGTLVASTRAEGGGSVDAVALAGLGDAAGVHVDLPAIDPETGAWVLRFSQALRDATGVPAGAAVIAVDSEFFVSGYEPARMGERGVVALLGNDGVFRARRTGDEVTAGDTAGALAAPAEEGVAALVRHPWDGVERFAAARALYGFPLQVLVGVAAEEALAPVARRRRTYLLRAGAASLLLAGLVVVLGRMSFQLQKLRQREYLEKVEHAERVEHIAYHDGLTGLPNRSFFSKLLEQKVAEAARYQRELAVMFVDLDRFKQINDTLGHEAGDELLREVARRLRSCLRESDVVARLGGDEFVVLLPDLAAHRYATTVAGKVLEQIGRPFVLLGQEFTVTGSLGISLFPRDGRDEQTLTKNADIAMYRAKEEGRNNFQFYSAEINANSLERLALEARLRHAVEQEQFLLHYQPRREARHGQVTGVEALLRWEHPDLGTVPPARFLTVAEESGLIVPIGRWVLRQACRHNAAWQAAGLTGIRVAVNLSARQLFDEHLVRDVREALQSSGLAADLLEIEIRESLLLRDVPGTLRVLQELKELGVRIVVDHFGAGYSWLARLDRFPLDAIKIDQSFVQDQNALSPGLADAVVAVGRSLHLTVVVQGVETAEQAAFVREHGCDEVQGFYLDRPLPASALAERLLAASAEPIAVARS